MMPILQILIWYFPLNKVKHLEIIFSGYGDVAPETEWGKIFYIIFSILGIPVMMTLVVSCGDVMTMINTKLFRLFRRWLCKNSKLVSQQTFQHIRAWLVMDSIQLSYTWQNVITPDYDLVLIYVRSDRILTNCFKECIKAIKVS